MEQGQEETRFRYSFIARAWNNWGEPERAPHEREVWSWDAISMVRPPPGGSGTSVKFSIQDDHVH